MTILQIAFLIIILVLFLFFIFYKKIIHVASIFVILIFFSSVALTLSAVFIPTLYKTGAEILVKDSDLGKQLKNLDDSFTQVGNVPNNILDSIGSIIGQAPRESFKSDLYNQFIDFSGGLIRVMILILGIIIMVISVYIRYSYSGLIESQNLARKVRQLEQEVNSLKQSHV